MTSCYNEHACGVVRKMENSVEKSFAQRLASNEKMVRDRALKKLRKYLGVKASHADAGVTREELCKLWKGLHYSMWMQDKPLLQEELSSRICSLLKEFHTGTSALNFAAAFFFTQANEWSRLDQWRVDKFMMLTRDFLNATFCVVKDSSWSLVSEMSSMIDEEVMDAKKEDKPDGLRLHLADIYLEELAKVGAEELNGEQILILLRPYIKYIQDSNRYVIADKIIRSVFGPILRDAKSKRRKQESKTKNATKKQLPRLKYDYEAIAQALFDIGKQEVVLPKVRRKLYKLVKRFRATTSDEKTTQGSVSRKRCRIGPLDDEAELKPSRKKRKMEKTSEIESDSKRLKEASQKSDSFTSKMECPDSAQKHVAFDLKRNSSRGLKEFVMSATTTASPYSPSRSPNHGILKVSPGDVEKNSTPNCSIKKHKHRLLENSYTETNIIRVKTSGKNGSSRKKSKYGDKKKRKDKKRKTKLPKLVAKRFHAGKHG